MRTSLLFVLSCLSLCTFGNELPEGYWGLEKTQPILDKTMKLHIDVDISALSSQERETVDLLLQVGEIFHELYLLSRHPESLEAGKHLRALHNSTDGSIATQNLLDLYNIFRGPIATSLDNERTPFLPVAPEAPARNVYPEGTTREGLTQWLNKHPEKRDEIQFVRGVVRKASPEQRKADVKILNQYPALEVLHPGLRDRISECPDGDYYGLPYSAAYADRLFKAQQLLWRAAEVIAPVDPDFSDYLRHRSRDILADDYEAGDAAWITGSFKNINAQIGSYETYDDPIFGVKSFFSLSLLLRDNKLSEELASAVKGLQDVQDSLPYQYNRKIRENIPVGVYRVLADFGQARGTNTATILPNESHIARKYGRTILLRHNIMTNPEIYKDSKASWEAAVNPKHADDLTLAANFQRTLWHEVGHYLGVDRDKQDRTLDSALGHHSDLMEELKADLVSLYTAPQLHKRGFHSDDELKAIYAAGILRTLQRVKPRKGQPYQNMQLMQMNYYLSTGLLSYDDNGKLLIDYSKYADTVAAMLKEVLALQHGGDINAVEKFIDTYFVWDDARQKIADAISAAAKYRFRMVTYEVLK